MATKKRMCAHGPAKQCYPSSAAAIRAALSYSRKRGTPLRPYFHHACRSWHVTKNPKW